VPTYLYATLLSGQYNIPNIYAEVDAVYTNTTSRWMPIAARAGPRRPMCGAADRKAARELGEDPVEIRRKNFIQSFPHQTPVIMCYDAGGL
jgi:carbon-monoxide dehydrogenase large subunit